MTSLWRRLVLRADEWLTTYIRKAVPAAHHIGQSVSLDRLHHHRHDDLHTFACCPCCAGGCGQAHRTPCDRTICEQIWQGPQR